MEKYGRFRSINLVVVASLASFQTNQPSRDPCEGLSYSGQSTYDVYYILRKAVWAEIIENEAQPRLNLDTQEKV